MKKKVLMSVAVLSAVAVVCVVLLAVFNKLWFVSEDERFARSVSSIMQADSFDIIYNFDDSDDPAVPTGNYGKIKAFNDEIGATDNYQIRKVRRAKGGRDDGYYLFQSRGRGFGGGYVEVLIGYTPEGKLTGVKKLDISKSNDRAGNIDWDIASDSISGKTYQDEFKSGKEGGSQIVAGTQATVTLGGASEAIKISNQFFKTYILGEGTGTPKSEIVTSSAVIAQLTTLFTLENSEYSGRLGLTPKFVKYPLTTPWESVRGGKTRVKALYYINDTYVIAEAEAQLGEYGNWTLLVLLNNDTNLVAAVNPTAWSYLVAGGYDASKLKDAKNLTALYKNVELGNIMGMTGENAYLQGASHPTESIDGLKIIIAHVLKNAPALRGGLAAFIANEQAGEGQNG